MHNRLTGLRPPKAVECFEIRRMATGGAPSLPTFQSMFATEHNPTPLNNKTGQMPHWSQYLKAHGYGRCANVLRERPSHWSRSEPSTLLNIRAEESIHHLCMNQLPAIHRRRGVQRCFHRNRVRTGKFRFRQAMAAFDSMVRFSEALRSEALLLAPLISSPVSGGSRRKRINETRVTCPNCFRSYPMLQ